jgi:hypothetical protein
LINCVEAPGEEKLDPNSELTLSKAFCASVPSENWLVPVSMEIFDRPAEKTAVRTRKRTKILSGLSTVREESSSTYLSIILFST